MSQPRYSPADIDLTDPDNVVQARFEFDRCETVPDFATWAMKWGRNAVTALADAAEIDPDELADLKNDLSREEINHTATADELSSIQDDYAKLSGAVDDAIEQLEIIADAHSGIPAIITGLNKALA